ncbi:MAG: tetratricopeptide repeat protein [Acidobacteriota bacterium]|nr:tetratricopeptide repeat protein [Acidobacteriota bacterium]MDH3785133.1 tetratricopeptide repeat protein [Acidobacteriota bacterium]
MNTRPAGKSPTAGKFLATGLLVTLTIVGCSTGGPTTPARYVASLENTATTGADAASIQYVGLQSCRSCHLGKAATFSATGMGRSFGPMEAGMIRADFVDNNTFVDETGGLHYTMTERDGQYFQRESLLDGQSRPYNVVEHRLIYWVGSNHHSRGYVLEREGRLFQAPVCWYPQTEAWDFCPGFDKHNEHFVRETSQSCVFCHNAVMVAEEGERNRFREPIPHGIDCERCHGPGSLHADRWSDGDHTPDGGVDPSIVHPRRLDATGRNEICYQCHLGDARATERVSRHGSQLADYRPGTPLLDVMVPFRYRQPTEWDFGLSAQADRMLLSRCFTESAGRLECVTCHDPHVTTYDADRPQDLFQRRCLSCHELESCLADPAARAATEPLADDCVQCHMRRAEPDDQRFTEFTDHWIRTNIDVKVKDHRTEFDIEPVFPDSFATLSAGEQAYHEARALFLLADEAPGSQRMAMHERAEVLFAKTLDEGLESRDVHFFRGKNMFNIGRFDDAEPSLRRALELAPSDPEASLTLGQIVLARGDHDEASDLFGDILATDPTHVGALAEAGRVDFARGRRDAAMRRFEQAASLEPESADLQVNWGMVLAADGQWEVAAERAESAVLLAPNSTETWSFYVNVMREMGRESAMRQGQNRLEALRR